MTLEDDDEGAVEVSDSEAWPSDEDDDDLPATSGLHPRDLANFHKLCSALLLFPSTDLTPAIIEKADSLLRAYCTELIEVRSTLWHRSTMSNMRVRYTAPALSDPTITILLTRATSNSITAHSESSGHSCSSA